LGTVPGQRNQPDPQAKERMMKAKAIIVLYPGIPPLVTPEFSAWLSNWHKQHNSPAAIESRRLFTLTDKGRKALAERQLAQSERD
jgi:hypothetical protein